MTENPGELSPVEEFPDGIPDLSSPEDPEAYGPDDARADDQDDLAEQTDNSGEEGEDAPQGAHDIADEDGDDTDAG